MNRQLPTFRFLHVYLLGALLCIGVMLQQAEASTLNIAVSRAELLSFPRDMSEVIVADPEIADVHNHGTTKLSVIGKKMGQTNVRVLDKDGKMLGSYDVIVGYDLPSLRKALKQFMPAENIGVEMINTNIALTGQVSSAEAVNTALKIAREYLKSGAASAASQSSAAAGGNVADPDDGIVNLLQVASGQQVMLRVRVGEVNRGALKSLGIEWSSFGGAGKFGFFGAKDTGVNRFLTDSDGIFQIDPTQTASRLGLNYTSGSLTLDALITALERDSLFKLLAEPNLTAISGQEAEFLAGGEIPIPTPQATSGGGTPQISVEYKPFGVAIKFKPYVLSPNRLRLEVQPEVSELDNSIAVNLSGFSIPGLTTRRAKTTIEMAPGESFMIAGLIKDQSQSTINSVPGVKELPVIGALFRSTNFQRNETELVIAVTPYLVDPVRSSDIKMPTDNFAPATQMDMVLYGKLGGISKSNITHSQTPTLEGPSGFMVE